MKIGEKIRIYRKKQNLTQEQVASYLGVTAPAVNKWENGYTYPDITLLASLARVLQVDVNTLLSFNEKLEDSEIDQMIKQLSEEIGSSGFEVAFTKASELLRRYSNCDKLILYAAQIINAYLVKLEIAEKERYEKQIEGWFHIVAQSKEKELANAATASLCQKYMQNGQYEQAQKLLDTIPAKGIDKRVLQAKLYEKQNRMEKAYEVHETMLFQNVNSVISSIVQIMNLLCKEKEFEKAYTYVEILRITSNTFDLGQYIACSAELEIAVEQKEKEKSLLLLEEMIHGIDTMDAAKSSSLYQHMQFKENSGIVEFKKSLARSLEQASEFTFIRETPKFKRIVEQLG